MRLRGSVVLDNPFSLKDSKISHNPRGKIQKRTQKYYDIWYWKFRSLFGTSITMWQG